MRPHLLVEKSTKLVQLAVPRQTRPTAESLPCSHRGEVTRQQESDLCGSRGEFFDVFTCDLHGECAIGRICQRQKERPCVSCDDRLEPVVRGEIDLSKRHMIFHCYPKLGEDWRANCLATFQYRDVFNGRVLVSIVAGKDCEKPKVVMDWFNQFGDLEIDIVPNEPKLGLNTTFRDQLRAIQRESGIVFKSHTKGISHAGDPFRQWRENMMNGCLGNIAAVEQKFRKGIRTFGVFRTVSNEGAAVMGQISGDCKTAWPGWHFPGAVFWFDTRFIPESFFSLPMHYYENEAFSCHMGPVETSFALMPNNINFQAASIDQYFKRLNVPIAVAVAE
jgi:hypothetical protein